MAVVAWWYSGPMGRVGNGHIWWDTRLASGRGSEMEVQKHGLQIPPRFSFYLNGMDLGKPL